MACVVKGCTEHTGAKSLMCASHWYKLPETLRREARKGTEKGQHTLRTHPTREWFGLASKYVGDLRHLVIRVDAANKIHRKHEDKAPQPAA